MIKNIDTYLSVDLDFWGSFKYKKEHVSLFIEDVLSLDVPIHIVSSHEDILKYINKYRIKNLINIDFHSDLCDETTHYTLNDGTWANFYKYPHTCNFIWIYPRSKIYTISSGRCDITLSKKWENIDQRYSCIKKIKGINTLPSIWYSAIEGVCFAISKDYLYYSMEWLADKYIIFRKYREELKGYQGK